MECLVAKREIVCVFSYSRAASSVGWNRKAASDDDKETTFKLFASKNIELNQTTFYYFLFFIFSASAKSSAATASAE